MELLIQKVRRRIAKGTGSNDDSFRSNTKLPAVASAAAFNKAEMTLGFSLPPLLRQLYLEIANGGFGPEYGFLGVEGGATNEDGDTILGLYEDSQSMSFRKAFPRWPQGMVQVCNWGCAMYSVIDCSTPRFEMFHFEPNPGEEELGFVNCLIPHNRTFDEYVEAWINGVDLLNDVFPGYADGA